MFTECGELLCGRFPLKLKEFLCKTYIGPAILYGSEAMYLIESEMEILRRTERSMMRAMCGVKLKYSKRLDFGVRFE